MCKAIMSHNVKTTNVVLQITVPKRTGRRRKKGSTGPYLDCGEAQRHLPSSLRGQDDGNPACPRKNSTAGDFLRVLQDNIDRYEAKAVGVVEQTHRFRSKSTIVAEKKCGRRTLMLVDMSDFVYSTTSSPFMTKIRDHILPFECSLQCLLTQYSYSPLTLGR